MNIESLKYLFLIAKEGNISSVAKKVHLSQSALSQQIQKLENDLGKKLLIRSNKGVVLTSTGEIVFKFAENILRTYDKMMMELAEAEKTASVVKIEACHSIADYALPCTLIKANGAYPNHRYELTSNPSAQIISDVTNNICDVGFSCDNDVSLDGSAVTQMKVGENSIVLIARNDDTLPDAMTTEQLLGCCLITFTERNNITSTLIKNLLRMGYAESSLNCSLRVEGIESAKMLVTRGFGIAFLPYISVKEELYKKQYKIIKVPEFNMNLNITMLYKRNCPSHVSDFVDWFKNNGSKSFC
jgi:molybdate transport repressor ModE-like protein